MKGERAGDARDRIEINVSDVTVFCEQGVNLCLTKWFGTGGLRAVGQSEGARRIVAERHFS